jgi:hypothetical protein
MKYICIYSSTIHKIYITARYHIAITQPKIHSFPFTHLPLYLLPSLHTKISLPCIPTPHPLYSITQYTVSGFSCVTSSFLNIGPIWTIGLSVTRYHSNSNLHISPSSCNILYILTVATYIFKTWPLRVLCLLQ